MQKKIWFANPGPVLPTNPELAREIGHLPSMVLMQVDFLTSSRPTCASPSSCTTTALIN